MDGNTDDRNNGGQEGLDSLFEGMVLMTPSQFDNLEETPPSKSKHEDNDQSGISSFTTVSQPLDENLFSDLNLYALSEDAIQETPSSSVEASRRSVEASGTLEGSKSSVSGGSVEGSRMIMDAVVTRQGSRKKKRSLKIGYGRNDFLVDDALHNSNNNNYGDNNLCRSDSNVSTVEDPTERQSDVADQAHFLSMESDRSNSNGGEKADFSEIERKLDSDYASHDKKFDSVETRPLSGELRNTSHVDESEAGVEEKTGDDRKNGEIGFESTEHGDVALHDSVQIKDQDSKDDGCDATGQIDQPSNNEETEVASESIEESSMEKKLEYVKTQISRKLKELHERADAISLSRKITAQRRRQAAEQVNLASNRLKELEKELGEACEREDFERADSLSESLVVVEKSKQEAMHVFRSAEADCDSFALKMQEILESQIVIEEEGIKLLECLQKEAEDIATSVIREAEDSAAKEVEKWLVEKEALELKKMEVDLELKVIRDADEKLKESIDESVGDDIEEKTTLSRKQDVLMQELQELLALVKAKEEEILENDIRIQDVDKRISVMVSKFEDESEVMKTKSEELISIQGQLESNSKILYMKRKEFDESLALAEAKRANLTKLAGDAGEEAKVLHELVSLRKSITSSFLQSRENIVRLAEKERQILEEVQDLRQQVADARTSLQELSSVKANLNQDIISMKQKISFIEKRGPELEAEKKVAAAARNFKEAGRVAAEAKKLSLERKTVIGNMERALLDLQNLEGEIQDKITALQDAENVITSKEREAAMARCEHLRLVAASAREESSAALEVEDLEEAGNFLAEAEAADSEADKLQEICNFDGEQFMKISRQSISVAMASTLIGKQLAEKTAGFQTNVE